MNLPDMNLDLGDGIGLGFFAAAAVVFGFFGVVTDRAEGKDKEPIGLAFHQRGNFFRRVRWLWCKVVHGKFLFVLLLRAGEFFNEDRHRMRCEFNLRAKCSRFLAQCV